MADASTKIEGGERFFPNTRWTLIQGAGDPNAPNYAESIDHLARIYWRPVYAYVRRKWNRSNDEAKEITQEFFLSLCEKEFLKTLSPERGRFRSYVRAALDNFVRMKHRSAVAQKRGGGALHFSLSDEEGFEPSAGEAPDQVFLKEWVRSILTDAAAQMEREYREAGKQKAFELFRTRELNPPAGEDVGYEALAKKFGLSVSDATVTAFRARQRFRALILERVRDTSSSEEDAQAELRELFGKRGS